MKKTKKTMFAAFLCAAFATQAVAQMYGSVQVGYSFPTAVSSPLNSANVAANSISTTNTTGVISTTRTAIYNSFGGGLNAGLTVGKMFNEYIGVDLGINYLAMSEQSIFTSASNTGTSYLKLTGNQLRITPGFIIAIKREKFSPYGRFGVVLPVINDILWISDSKSSSGSSVSTSKILINNKFTVGYNTALGVKFALSDKLSFFSEASLLSLGTRFQHGKYTELTSNGVSILEQRSDADRNIEFVESVNNGSTTTVQPAYTANFNSIGLNAGLNFGF